VAIPSIFGCRGVEAASAFERSLGRSRLPGHHLGDHCTGLQGLPSSDGVVVFGNSP
jgi:hypothetical protein